MTVKQQKTKIFVDTNILVYSVDLSADNRHYHRASLEILRPNEQEILCLSPQILGEFYAVITNAAAVKNPIAPMDAVSRIKRFSQMPNIQLLSLTSNFQLKCLELLEINPLKGSKVFDIFHLATMLTHDIKRIYTFNDIDFNWYQDIDVIVPCYMKSLNVCYR